MHRIRATIMLVPVAGDVPTYVKRMIFTGTVERDCLGFMQWIEKQPQDPG
jgi:hypothetical protein